MKIGIDARFYRKSTGGIGRYTRALIRELSKIDKENQYIIYLTPEDEKEYDQQITINDQLSTHNEQRTTNFQKKVINISHYSLAEQTKFLSILNKDKLDLVHFTNFNHPIFYRGKSIITIHDLTVLYFPVGKQQKDPFRRWAFTTVMNNAIKKSEKIIAVSKATKNDIVKTLNSDPKKIEVIYEGIDSDYSQKFRISNFEFRNLKKKYNISKPYLLFLSQWRPHKGLPDLIKAFEILKSKFKIEHQLVIGGKPNFAFPEILKAINDSPFTKDIITPGFIPEEDLPAIYAGADVFVFPSHYEGFGLPPLEAMACGIPVVAANVSCMPEVLGNAAEYFSCGDVDNMAQKINDVISDKNRKEEMIEAGFRQTKKYSWAKMAKETLQIYHKVLKSK